MNSISAEIKTTAISQLAKLLTDKTVWQTVLGQVKSLEDSSLSGSERKAKAIEYLKEDFTHLGSLLLNVLIELAVLFIRLKFGVVV